MKNTKILSFIFAGSTSLIMVGGLFFSDKGSIKALHAEEIGELVVLNDITIDNIFGVVDKSDTFADFDFNFKQTTRWGDDFGPDTTNGLPNVSEDTVNMKSNGCIFEAEGEVVFSMDFDFSQTVKPNKVVLVGTFTSYSETKTNLEFRAFDSNPHEITISDYGYSVANLEKIVVSYYC